MEVVQVAGGCNATLQALDVGPEMVYYACDRVIICWSHQQSRWAGVLEHHTARVNCLVALPEGGVLSGGCDNQLILWLPGSPPDVHTLSASVVQCSCSGDTVVSLTNAGTLVLWTRTEGALKEEQRFEFGTNLQETSVLFKTGGLPAFACGGCDSLVHIYLKCSSWEFSASLHGHTKGVRALSYRNGLIASASHDSTIRLWRVHETPPTNFIHRFGHTQLQQAGTSVKLEAVLTSHQAPVQSVAFSPDGFIVSSSLDFTVMVWAEEQTAWTPRFTMGQMSGNKNAFFGAATDPQGKHIFAHSFNGAVYHWQCAGNSWLPALAPSGHLSTVTSITLGDNFLLTTSQDQTCRIFASEDWIELSRPLVHGYDLNCAAFGHNLLVAGGDEKVIRVFEPSTISAGVLNKFAGVRLEATLATAAQALGLSNKPEEGGVVEIPSNPPLEDFLSTHTLWPECRKLFSHPNEITALALAHNSKTLASACKAQNPQDAQIFLWDLTSMNLIAKLQGPKLTVLCLRFSPNDEFLLSAGRDRECDLYRKEEGVYVLHRHIPAHSRMVYSCAWRPDSERFVTVSRDKRVKEWDTSGQCLCTYKSSSEVTACVYLQSQLVAIGSDTGEISILQLSSADATVTASCKQAGGVTALATANNFLFSGGSDFTVRVYRLS